MRDTHRAILHNSRGRSPENRSGRRSRSRTEPLAPRAEGPAAPSTLAAKPRQPSGIPPSADSPSKAHRLKYRTQQKSPIFRLSFFKLISSFLSSRAASSQVLSAFVSLTTVFGMGTGVSSQLSPLNLRVCSLKTIQKKFRRLFQAGRAFVKLS